MPTIPTGEMERELKKLYLRWIGSLAFDAADLQARVASFIGRAQDLIESLGGQVASVGALAGFPTPRTLELSPLIGDVVTEMQRAAVSASITAGLNSREAARAMFVAGMGKSYRKLERIARTETVSAYWKNAWDSIADLPTLVMVWGSEDGPRTCAWCRERDGLVMASPDLRDHPNGRCTPLPTVRSQVRYRGSVARDGEIYFDPSWQRTQDERVMNQLSPIKDFQGGRLLV